jgi:hypothetical protein
MDVSERWIIDVDDTVCANGLLGQRIHRRDMVKSSPLSGSYCVGTTRGAPAHVWVTLTGIEDLDLQTLWISLPADAVKA